MEDLEKYRNCSKRELKIMIFVCRIFVAITSKIGDFFISLICFMLPSLLIFGFSKSLILFFLVLHAFYGLIFAERFRKIFEVNELHLEMKHQLTTFKKFLKEKN